MRSRRLKAGAAVFAAICVMSPVAAADRATPAASVRPAPAVRPPDRGTGAAAGIAGVPAPPSPPSSIPDTIDWPAAAGSAVAYAGAAAVTVHGSRRPAPIASVAKVMTAYVVLTDHPLAEGSAGPTITVTAAQAALYEADSADGQSVIRVSAGERLTERQALQELLLRSANNVAALLAEWDAGSVPAFLARMNAAAARLGLADTRYADPAGLSRDTVSTAADQVRLGLEALGLRAFAELVALPSAHVPVAGTIENSDTMLGVDGIVGLKTGYTKAAGGTMIVAARVTVRGRALLIVGALLGVPGDSGTVLGNTLDAGDGLVCAAVARLGG